MKVLFVDPPSLHHSAYSRFVIPHFGYAYMAALLRREGHSVRCFTGSLHQKPLDDFAREVTEFEPDLIGFSAPTFKVESSARMAGAAKALRPSVKTIIGGWHVSALPEETLNLHPEFDYAFAGEAENAIVPMVETLADGRGLSDMPGISHRADGAVVTHPTRPEPADVRTLPRPAWDILQLDQSRPMYRAQGLDLPMMAGRGCPFSCNFCDHVTGRRVRVRDLDDIMDEIEEGIGRWGVDGVQFYDETFTLNAKRTFQLCEAFIDRGLHRRVRWNCTSRADTTSPELLSRMREAGCRVILFGIESGDETVLKKVGKNTTRQQALDAARWCREAGILSDTSFVIGLPGDNRRSVRETIRFSRRVNGDFVSYFSFIPFPATEGARFAERNEENLRLLHRDWNRYAPQFVPPCELQDVPAWRLVALRYWAYARFYLRPSRIGRLMAMLDWRNLAGVFWRLAVDTLRKPAWGLGVSAAESAAEVK